MNTAGFSGEIPEELLEESLEESWENYCRNPEGVLVEKNPGEICRDFLRKAWEIPGGIHGKFLEKWRELMETSLVNP